MSQFLHGNVEKLDTDQPLDGQVRLIILMNEELEYDFNLIFLLTMHRCLTYPMTNNGNFPRNS